MTLTNSGKAVLAISGITAGGTNLGDFVQSNNCGTSLAAGASCQISVTFTPGAAGARTATLSIADNGSGSPQTVSLTGSGPDFTVGAGTTSTATVAAGQPATYMVSVGSAAGFAQTVTLSCSGAPTAATCSVSPSTVAVSGGSAVTATVTVTTTARSMGLPVLPKGKPIGLMLVMMGASLVVVVGMLSRLTTRPNGLRWAPALATALVACVAIALSSCGGGSNGGGGASGTPAGNYTIMVTGNFSSGSANLSHATKLTLVVQ